MIPHQGQPFSQMGGLIPSLSQKDWSIESAAGCSSEMRDGVEDWMNGLMKTTLSAID